jgi:hypothetical protein
MLGEEMGTVYAFVLGSWREQLLINWRAIGDESGHWEQTIALDVR